MHKLRVVQPRHLNVFLKLAPIAMFANALAKHFFTGRLNDAPTFASAA
jgi:hypothetical protein